ncbi:hypothetical protein UFOVP898_16 [uncultured Caudovirales phage]|uniref:Uncharacterized protein n=1 Tax=uncultured Caudovirales phage TaxID=2100421 RepID=A0A6J5PIW3_9CAUD|nr:hypothetical protein UFOVP898_16 [uncultured Caudovirales phage]CAB4176601.1 hypothetical protein UFOVP985_43 [uncultured Caudovirales phage]CAB4181164.1 hypothetical protein UFOVP1073_14 [uncultured Caudovirales phage]CAB4198153.1 hypothetical protein UFOVP1308_53 [uncultured Caudovirales phage]CAB4210410.1 hypothetical protein UFOVP1423_16 [uncultured Caudovirales phage]
MPGDTTSISVTRFSIDWDSNVPIRELCEQYAISKDQLSRLCHLWGLPPRKNRATYFKPSHPTPPSHAEDEASGSSCELAPSVKKRVEALRQGIGGPKIHGTSMYSNGEVKIPVFGVDSVGAQSSEFFVYINDQDPPEKEFEWTSESKRHLFQGGYRKKPRESGGNSKD